MSYYECEEPLSLVGRFGSSDRPPRAPRLVASHWRERNHVTILLSSLLYIKSRIDDAIQLFNIALERYCSCACMAGFLFIKSCTFTFVQVYMDKMHEHRYITIDSFHMYMGHIKRRNKKMLYTSRSLVSHVCTSLQEYGYRNDRNGLVAVTRQKVSLTASHNL